MQCDPLELKDKLDAMLSDTKVDAVMVNGPEDVFPAWEPRCTRPPAHPPPDTP
jgi:hypothetical protein